MRNLVYLTAAACALTTGTWAMGEPMNEGRVDSGAGFMLSRAAQDMRVGNSEVMHAQATAETGRLAYETSQIALAKSGNPLIKQFARFESDEQATIADLMKKMYPNMPKPMLTAEEQAMVDSLNRMPAGPAFDRAYVTGQIDGHEKLLRIQDTYLGSGTNFSQRTMATLAKGMIEQHLVLLKAYQVRR